MDKKNIDEINRKVTKVQKLTKNKELGGINESIDIDMAYIKDFKGTVKEDAKNIKGMVYTKEAGWGGNTKRAGQRFKKGAEDLIDAGKAAAQKRVNPITDMKNSTDFRNATTDFQRENPELAAVLNNNEKKGSAEYQEALGEYNNYVQTKMGNAPIETGLYDSTQMSDSEKIDENGNRKDGYAMTNMENGSIYINAAATDMSDPNELIGVAGHENIHAGGERSEKVADRGMEQAQNAWNSENKFNNNTTGGGYSGGQDWYSSNYDTEAIKNGTSGASGVKDAQPYYPLHEHKQGGGEYKSEKTHYYDTLGKNTNIPENQTEAEEAGWKKQPAKKNKFHTWDGEDTVKYLYGDGREAIYNRQTGKETKNRKNQATYNQFESDDVRHIFDMDLYIKYGTGPEDPSSFLQRSKKAFDGAKEFINK